MGLSRSCGGMDGEFIMILAKGRFGAMEEFGFFGLIIFGDGGI